MDEFEAFVAVDLSNKTCNECGEAFYAHEQQGDRTPVLFDVDCPTHDREFVVYHHACLPPHLAEALRTYQIQARAQWN